MHAVGDQRRGADPAADPDPVDGDQLVAGEPDQRRGKHPAQICQRLRLENRRIDSYPASTADNDDLQRRADRQQDQAGLHRADTGGAGSRASSIESAAS